MRILFVYDCVYPESLGGVEHRNFCLSAALAARGHSVTIAGWVRVLPPAQPGVTVLQMPYQRLIHDGTGQRSTMASLKFAAAAAKLDLRSYDIVEAANIPYTHLLPLALKCALAKKPFVITWHEYFGPYWRSYLGPIRGLAYQAIEWCCVQIGQVFAQSRLTAGRVQRARLGRRHRPVPILASGVWLRDVRAALDAPAPDAPPLLYAGRLIAEKRIDLLLRAVAEMPATGEGILLGIAGDGPDRARLEALAASLGIEARVAFFGRLPDIADVLRLLAGARVAVQPSSREGFGLFALEAMALGRPVVTCESPDNAMVYLARHDIEGICTRPEPGALAAALTRLLDDEGTWQRLSEAATRRAARYDWAALAAEWEAYFRSVIEARA